MNLGVFLLLFGISLDLFSQTVPEILYVTPQRYDDSFLNKKINFSQTFNLRKQIYALASKEIVNSVDPDQNLLWSFSKWYNGAFFWGRENMLFANMDKARIKAPVFKNYDHSGERPLEAYITTQNKFIDTNLKTLNIDLIKKIHRSLLSKDSYISSDTKIRLKDFMDKRNSEKTNDEDLGKIRDGSVYWLQGAEPINKHLMYELNTGKSLLSSSPKDLLSLSLTNPLLSEHPAVKGAIFYALPSTKSKRYYTSKISRQAHKWLLQNLQRHAYLIDDPFKKFISPEFRINYQELITSLLNFTLKELQKDLANAKIYRDIVQAAAKFAQSLVSVHPFVNGNGRLTRFLVEIILNNYGLPSPIYTYADMDASLSSGDYLQLLTDSVVLGKRFNDEVYTLIQNNIPYYLVTSHLIPPKLFPKIDFKPIIPLDFIVWTIAEEVPVASNLRSHLLNFKKWRANNSEDKLIALASQLLPTGRRKLIWNTLFLDREYVIRAQNIGPEAGRRNIADQPSATNLFITFDGKSYGKEPSFFETNCKSPKYGNHPIILKKSVPSIPTGAISKLYELDENCMPDVVYNWSNDSNLDMLKLYYSSRTDWKKTFEMVVMGKINANAFFTSFSPLASYGYGNNIIRIKLKKGTKFFFIYPGDIEGCNKIPEKIKQESVVVRHIRNEKPKGYKMDMVEYLLCTFGPVDSWSSNTKEIYDEMVKQYLSYKDSPKNFEAKNILYVHLNGTPLLLNFTLDKIQLEQSLLNSNFLEVLNSIKTKYNVPPVFNPAIYNLKNPPLGDEHFQSKRVYWNKFAQ